MTAQPPPSPPPSPAGPAGRRRRPSVSGPRWRSALATAGPALAVLAGQGLVFHQSPLTAPGLYLFGILVGLLSAMVALGMALIYRANHILNFAQSELGLVPTALALCLIAYSGIPYLVALAVGLLGALVVGGVVQGLVMERFARAPRLILTVATIGLAQLLTVASLAVPGLWGREPLSQPPIAPFAFSFELAPMTFGSGHVLALVLAPVVLGAVAAFLRFTQAGVAVRAAAERADRAALLGVPVSRLHGLVWRIAALLSFVGVFLRASAVGMPFTPGDGFSSTSFGALLAALTALALGRFTNLPAIALSAVALGIAEQQLIYAHGRNPALVYPMYGLIILVALGVRRAGRLRVDGDTASSWRTIDEIRPVPAALRRNPEVLVATWGGLGLLALVAWRLPDLPFMEPSRLLLASGVAVYAIVGISVVVLTGWAGQVSLGQMGFVGVGAAIGAVATGSWHLDLSLALLVSGGAGAVVAVVVGLPALRVRGLFLAVTTLAFATTSAYYLLNPTFFDWVPTGRIERPPLFGVLDLEDQGAMYRLCLVCLVLVVLAVARLRRSRTGRALLALRENDRGAQVFGIASTRAKLTGFALSGFGAAAAGCLFVHLTRSFSVGSFGAGESFGVFTATVVGGLGSQTGAILGALFARGGTWFLPGSWQLLPSAIGVLGVLLVLPGGFSGLLFRLRDRWLRSVARRHGVVVPELDHGAAGDGRETGPAAASAGRSLDRDGGGRPGPERVVPAGPADRSVPSRGWRTGAANPQASAGAARSPIGGRPLRPLLVLAALAVPAWADRASVAVLEPRLRAAVGLDDLGVTALTIATVHLGVLLAISVAFQAERRDRVRITQVGAVIFTVFSLATAVVPPWWWAFLLVRAGAAAGVATVLSAHLSLVADYYDIPHRPAAYAAHASAMGLGAAAGVVVAWELGGRFGWRAPYLVLALPALVALVAARRLRDPGRGHFERAAMGLAGEAQLAGEPPPSAEESQRLVQRVASLRRLFFAMPFLAVALTGFGALGRELSQRGLGLGDGQVWRLEAVAELGQLAGVALAAVVGTRLARRDPAALVRLVVAGALGAALLVAGVAVAPNAALALAARIGLSAAVAALLPSVLAILSLAVPARARATGFAVALTYALPGLLVFEVAGGWVTDTFSIRAGVLVFAPVLVVGGLLAGRVRRDLDRDVANAWTTTAARAELLAARRRGALKQLVVRDLDVHYDDVQVLFGVDVEVGEGEIVALLGTNGAGKSTLLRAVTGVVQATGGAVVFEGRDVTSAPAHEIAAHGIAMVPGGRGVFGSLTVAENLRVAAWGEHLDRRSGPAPAPEDVLATFPALRERLGDPAANLSGGQQQMLALAMAFLSRPKLLAIDELSLGLAPTVVEQLLGVVRAINERGTTVILVEQSVNIALTLAERAYFMEKGEIRFHGPTSALLERPDVLRSVFLEGATAGLAGAGRATGGDGGGRARARSRPGTGAGREDAGTPGREGPAALEVAHVSVRFGGIRAVDDVSLRVGPGEILGIIGANGAGKTTVFDVVSGFTRPDAGRIVLAGEDVTGLGPAGRARRGLGRSFQDARLFPALTVEETIKVALERAATARDPLSAVLRLPAHQDSEHALACWVDELVELLGIGAFRTTFVHELSTGSRRIVDLACVLAHRPSVVLLDEPSSGIAQRESEALGALISKVRDLLGAAVLLIEHDMPLVSAVADRLVALDQGRIVADGTARAVLAHPEVVASYLGDRRQAIARSGPRG